MCVTIKGNRNATQSQTQKHAREDRRKEDDESKHQQLNNHFIH